METDTKIQNTQTSATSKMYSLMAQLLESADIRIDGDRDQDMRIHDPKLADRVFAMGNVGLGEAYMDGQWDANRLDAFFTHLLAARLDQKVKPLRLIFHALRTRLLNRQTRKRAWTVSQVHYDLGNDFYAAMLDKRMTYTCGFWADGAQTLDAAQEAKLDMICQKLGLEPGMRLLDIGCGWGSLMGFAAELLQAVVHQRYKLRRSIIVTSNRVVQDWGKYLGDNTMSGTILDRLMHRCTLLEFEGKSYRLKEAAARLARSSDDD